MLTTRHHDSWLHEKSYKKCDATRIMEARLQETGSTPRGCTNLGHPNIFGTTTDLTPLYPTRCHPQGFRGGTKESCLEPQRSDGRHVLCDRSDGNRFVSTASIFDCRYFVETCLSQERQSHTLSHLVSLPRRRGRNLACSRISFPFTLFILPVLIQKFFPTFPTCPTRDLRVLFLSNVPLAPQQCRQDVMQRSRRVPERPKAEPLQPLTASGKKPVRSPPPADDERDNRPYYPRYSSTR
jgi:hypothetical protein